MKGLLRGIGYFLLYVVFTIVVQVVLSMLIVQFAVGKGITDQGLIEDFANNNMLGMTVVSGLLTILFLYLLFKIPKKNIRKEWKLNSFEAKDLFKGCLLLFSLSSAFSLLTLNANIENARIIALSSLYYSKLFPFLGTILMILNLLVLAPLAEEIALRGVVYTRIEKTNKPIVAIIVSAVLFGLMHLMAGGIILVLGAVIMGLAFGLLLHKYKSLQLCVIAHVCANLPDFIYSKERFTSQGLVIGLIAAFCVIAAASFIWILKGKRESQKA